MDRILKPLTGIAAAYLIFYDLATLFLQGDFSGKGLFSTVLLYFIPCGILTGAAVLSYMGEAKAKKPLSVTAAVVFGFMAAIRIFTFIFQLVLIAIGQGETSAAEYFEVAKFFGEILIITAMLFLMVRLIRGGFAKVCLSLSLTAVVIFVAYYIADVVFAVQSMTDAGQSGLATFLSQCLSAQFVMGILLTLSYLILFSSLCGLFDKKQIKDKK